MFLHCECGWSQDDFWQDGEYTPLDNDYFNSLKKELLKGKIYLPDDKPYPMMHDEVIFHDDKGFYLDSRNHVANQLERIAKNIRKMAVPTFEEWSNIKENFKCPKCGRNDRIQLD